MLFALVFSNEHVEFREAEIESLKKLMSLDIVYDVESLRSVSRFDAVCSQVSQDVCVLVEARKEDLLRLLTRVVLVHFAIEVWVHADSFDAAFQRLKESAPKIYVR